MVLDTIAIVILLYTFSEYAKASFYNNRLRKMDYPLLYDEKQTGFDSALVVVITNLYAYYKIKRRGGAINIDRSIDTFL